MVELLQRAAGLQKLMLFLMWAHEDFMRVMATEQVHFAKYGYCAKTEPFDLAMDTYQVFSTGDGLIHQNTECSMSFKAAPGHGVCMSFKKFDMNECHTRLLVYKAKNRSGEAWKELTCQSDRPSQLCTSERYVTLRVHREQLTGYKNYKFEIEVVQSTSLTDEGVVFASIGFVIGIIVAVVVFLIFIALLVYCCCRKKLEGTSNKRDIIPTNDQVQPTAPPLMEGEDRQDPGMHLYPYVHLQQEVPMLEPPPPYDQPPSYAPLQS